MMTRLVGTAGVLLSLLFMLPLLLIRAQPYDDTELMALLLATEACPMPCFMDIRPGSTRSPEALARLRTHEWAVEVMPIITYSRDLIFFRWADDAPIPYQAQQWGRLYLRGEDIDIFEIRSSVAFGRVWLLLGEPAGGHVGFPEDDFLVHLFLTYADRFVEVLVPYDSRERNPHLWFRSATIRFISPYMVGYRAEIGCDPYMPLPTRACNPRQP